MIGDNIKRLMKANGYTQRELARRVGITESALSRYVLGSREPRANVLKNLAIAFGVSVDELISEGASQPSLTLQLNDALLVCELTRDRVRELEAREGELAREILSEIREAYEKYGGAYGMLQKINELEQRFSVIDCTECRHFVGCESCRTGQVCGDFERIEN